MKIVIVKVDRKTSIDPATEMTFIKHWEVEYYVQQTEATVYLTGNYTFMGTLPSEDDMIKTIKESLMNILKELL